VDSKDFKGDTPLQCAMWESAWCLRSMYWDLGAVDRNAPAMRLSYLIHVSTVLMDAGANVNARQALDGKTPLHYAVMCYSVSAVRRLLELGANATAVDQYDDTPLHDLVPLRDSRVCLIENEAASIEIAKCLVHAGARVDAISSVRRSSVLHKAAQYGPIGLVKCLVELGGNIHAQSDVLGGTALYAAVRNSVEVVEYLLNVGADVARDEYGTLLHIAAGYGSAATVKLLLDLGADT